MSSTSLCCEANTNSSKMLLLPNQLISEVYSYLDVRDLFRARVISKHFNDENFVKASLIKLVDQVAAFVLHTTQPDILQLTEPPHCSEGVRQVSLKRDVFDSMKEMSFAQFAAKKRSPLFNGLDFTRVRSIQYKFFKHLPGMLHEPLRTCNITWRLETEIDYVFKEFPNLTELHVHADAEGDVSHLQRFEKLTSLTYCSGALNVEKWKELLSVRKLNSLTLKDIKLKSVEQVYAIHNVTHLCVSNQRFSSNEDYALLGIPGITTLTLKDCIIRRSSRSNKPQENTALNMQKALRTIHFDNVYRTVETRVSLTDWQINTEQIYGTTNIAISMGHPLDTIKVTGLNLRAPVVNFLHGEIDDLTKNRIRRFDLLEPNSSGNVYMLEAKHKAEVLKALKRLPNLREVYFEEGVNALIGNLTSSLSSLSL